jgi:single-stranded-DNA-specific exonuclease
VGQDQKHLKLTLFDGKQDWDAIGFQLGHWLGQLTPGREVDIAYNLEFNEWQGQKKMQLSLKDIRLAVS